MTMMFFHTAFDTTDHHTLLQRLEHLIGIKRNCTELVQVLFIRQISVCTT